MCPGYYEMIRVPDQSFHLRLCLAQAAHQGIRAAAQAYGCSRNTVRKWLRRFQQEGKPGLQERSRRPRRIPHQTPAAVERRVLQARQRIHCFGPQRLKRDFDLPCSTGAIGRILRQKGLVRSRKKLPRPKRSLTAEKMKWPPFSRLQIDTKDLSDLPNYQPLIRQAGFPRFQYTARLVPEGATWLAFSETNDSTCALAFADRLLDCFRRHGVSLSGLTVQTDNGSEFGGTWNRKSKAPFSQLVEQKWKCHRHRFNPPHHSTCNSDVEALHGLIEPEFYDLESFAPSPSAFLNKAFSYQLFFNLVRKNSYKFHLTPEQLCRQRAPHVHPKIFYLPPVLLSSPRDLPTPQQLLVGHHLPSLLKKIERHSDILLISART